MTNIKIEQTFNSGWLEYFIFFNDNKVNNVLDFNNIQNRSYYDYMLKNSYSLKFCLLNYKNCSEGFDEDLKRYFYKRICLKDEEINFEFKTII
mgnify:CR=1 FL=1